MNTQETFEELEDWAQAVRLLPTLDLFEHYICLHYISPHNICLQEPAYSGNICGTWRLSSHRTSFVHAKMCTLHLFTLQLSGFVHCISLHHICAHASFVYTTFAYTKFVHTAVYVFCRHNSEFPPASMNTIYKHHLWTPSACMYEHHLHLSTPSILPVTMNTILWTPHFYLHLSTPCMNTTCIYQHHLHVWTPPASINTMYSTCNSQDWPSTDLPAVSHASTGV